MRAGRSGIAALLAGGMLSAVGCGGQPISSVALRAQMNGICTRTDHQLRVIGPVRNPAAAKSFLARGVAALQDEFRALDHLSPPSAARRQLSAGLGALAGEMAALRATMHQLDAGADASASFRALQQRLNPLERQGDRAWRVLGTPACLNR